MFIFKVFNIIQIYCAKINIFYIKLDINEQGFVRSTFKKNDHPIAKGTFCF